MTKLLCIVTALVAFGLATAVGAEPPISVDSAYPSSGKQGARDIKVVISGDGFEAGASVVFYARGSDSDRGGVVVKRVTVNSSKTLTAKLDLSRATINNYDIEVHSLSGRKGVGIQLFAVKPNQAKPPVALSQHSKRDDEKCVPPQATGNQNEWISREAQQHHSPRSRSGRCVQLPARGPD